MARFYITSRQGHILIMDRVTGEFVQGAESARIADGIVGELNAREPKAAAEVTETRTEGVRSDGKYGVTRVWTTTVREVAGGREDVMAFQSTAEFGGRGQLVGHHSKGLA